MKPDSIIQSDMKALLDWFESKYSPKDKTGAEIKTKGLKGNVIIRIFYEL